jgi:hypothetical protein
MDDVKQQNPNLDNEIYQLSKSNFYLYLALKSSRSGKYRNSLVWLSQAWQTNLKLALLSHYSYTLSLVSVLKLIALPATSLIWSDHHAWVQSSKKNKWLNKKHTLSSINRQIQLRKLLPSSQLEKQILQKLLTDELN